jgi:hypothetical protein
MLPRDHFSQIFKMILYKNIMIRLTSDEYKRRKGIRSHKRKWSRHMGDVHCNVLMA